jgi:xylan 1,4-beta-xylosidase
MSGLTNYYNGHKYHYLYITAGDDGERQIAIMSCEGNVSEDFVFPLSNPEYSSVTNTEGAVNIPNEGAVYLRCDVDYAKLIYSWSMDGESWNQLPVTLDQGIVSDQAGKGAGCSFTGAFVGMACQDLGGTALHADFEYFDYIENTIN